MHVCVCVCVCTEGASISIQCEMRDRQHKYDKMPPVLRDMMDKNPKYACERVFCVHCGVWYCIVYIIYNRLYETHMGMLPPICEYCRTPHIFREGDQYMLLDLGGGTADIVCHEVVQNFKVKEIIGPKGGDFGGKQIE